MRQAAAKKGILYDLGRRGLFLYANFGC